jgi:effector-binding domain-containing protein
MQTLLQFLFPAIAFAAVLARDDALAPDPQDAPKLLDARRAGLGDPAAIAALGIVQARGAIRFEGFPGEGKWTQILGTKGEARLEANFEGIPPSLRCTNGELYWITGMGGIEFQTGWKAAADVRAFALARHADWRDVYASAELVGEAKIGERTCHEIRMVPKSPRELGIEEIAGEQAPAPDTWWIDRETHDLVRVAADSNISGAGWQTMVTDYSDWKPVAGVRFPHQSRAMFGPEEQKLAIVLETENVATNVSFFVDPFQPDEKVLAALEKIRSGDTSNDPGFEVQERKELPAATIRVKCKPEELQQQLAIILPEVMGYLNREGLTPAGVPFARYHSFATEIDLEAGIPVTTKIKGNERVKASSLPGGEVVAGMHIGPYHELTRTHEALMKWMAEKKLEAAGGPWEIYWTDPGLERDPAKWRTEIVQPITRK